MTQQARGGAAVRYGSRRLDPLSVTAPGPGRSATLSTSVLPELGMQKTDAWIAASDAPRVRSPAGDPFVSMKLAVNCPKAPELRCPVVDPQKSPSPSAAVFVGFPVESGDRSTPNGASGCAFAGQSCDVLRDVVVVQSPAEFAPESQRPLVHVGQGWIPGSGWRSSVICTATRSGNVVVDVPAVPSSEPPANRGVQVPPRWHTPPFGQLPSLIQKLPLRDPPTHAKQSRSLAQARPALTPPRHWPAMALTTHVLTAGDASLGIGRGGPKKHPMSVQVSLLPVSVDVVAPRAIAAGSLQVTLKIDVAPSGVGEGGCAESPPPM